MTDIHAQARRGIKLLMIRQVFLQVFTFAGGIVMARVLDPADFGLYAIATFWVSMLALLGDFGLAPSFIQRKAELTDRDLQVGFTLQQILTTCVVALLMVGAPWLAALYPKAPAQTVWLVRTLAFSLYLTSWRSMSALQLERHLRYDRVAQIEVLETLSYQCIAVGMAIAGYGVWSLVWATLARGLLGTALVFLAAPWPVRLKLDSELARSTLKFGIPFQVQMLANQVVTGWITPVLVGVVIGPQAVGLLTWASSNGQKPLMLVDNVMRVAFPHFSRIQEDRNEVEIQMSRYLTYLLLPTGLWFAVLLVAGPPLVIWIYTDKWAPAIPALILFAMGLNVEVIGRIVGITLNSLGLVDFTTRIVLLKGFAIIAISIPLVLLIGFNGVPLGYLIATTFTNPWVFRGLGQGAMRRVLFPVAWVILPMTASIGVGFLTRLAPLSLILQALVTTFTVIIVYAGTAWITGPGWLRAALVEQLHKYLRPAPGQLAND